MHIFSCLFLMLNWSLLAWSQLWRQISFWFEILLTLARNGNKNVIHCEILEVQDEDLTCNGHLLICFNPNIDSCWNSYHDKILNPSSSNWNYHSFVRSQTTTQINLSLNLYIILNLIKSTYFFIIGKNQPHFYTNLQLAISVILWSSIFFCGIMLYYFWSLKPLFNIFLIFCLLEKCFT